MPSSVVQCGLTKWKVVGGVMLFYYQIREYCFRNVRSRKSLLVRCVG